MFRRIPADELYNDAMQASRKRSALRSATIGSSIALWLTLVALGTASTIRWEFTPGPAGSAEPRPGRGFEAVLVGHPDCPCTVASLHTLRDLVVRSEGRLRATVYFVGGPGPRPTRTERAADDIPDVDVSWTTLEGASRFGAATSGQVVLYRDGIPVFEGGLTVSRGLEGPSAGVVAIESALRDQRFVARAPVFGCPLDGGASR